MSDSYVYKNVDGKHCILSHVATSTIRGRFRYAAFFIDVFGGGVIQVFCDGVAGDAVPEDATITQKCSTTHDCLLIQKKLDKL